MNKARVFLMPLRAFVALHKLLLGIAAGCLLLYTLAGFFLVPYVARQKLTSYVHESLHCQLTIGELKFNPFGFVAEASDVRLSEANGAPMLGVQYLLVNASPLASIWYRAITLEEVRIDAPDVDLLIAHDGSVNLAKLAGPEAVEKSEDHADPPRLRIARFSVTDGRFGVVDRTRARPFSAQLRPIEFTLKDFQTEIGHQTPYSFVALTQHAEVLKWSGAFTVKPLGSHGTFRIEQLKLATLESYLSDVLPFVLSSGEASFGGSYRFALDPLAFDVELPRFSLRNVALAERADRGNAPVRFAQLKLEQLAFSYAKSELGVKLAELTGLNVEAWRDASGNLNLERLLAGERGGVPSSTPPAAPRADVKSPQVQTRGGSGRSATASRKPLWLHIETIRLTQAGIHAEDRLVSPAVRLDLAPIALTVSGWSSKPGAKLELDTDITINEKGRLSAHGALQLTPVELELRAKLSHLGLAFLQPYIAQNSALTLHTGELDVRGDLRYLGAPGGNSPFTFRGELAIADLHTTDQFNDEALLRWSNLALTGVELALDPNHLSINRIVAMKPYANVLIAQDHSLNITRVFNKDTSPAPAPSEDEEEPDEDAPGKGETAALAKAQSGPSSAPFPTRIRTVHILDGSAKFADQSVRPPFATAIVGLTGKVTGLSSAPGVLAQVKLAGKVDRYAPVTIAGKVNLLSAAKYTDLSLHFQNMELTTFNPYAGRFAGYNITKGKLSTGLVYKIDDRKLEARHHVIVDGLELGDKTASKDAAPIPMRLALALLRDRHGVIDLELPITGTLDDPKFRLGPIIWQVLLNVLTKAVVAPFAAIGKLFGGGEELAYVEFPSGSAELRPAESEKLAKLAKALVERPQLKVDVPKTVDPKVDAEAIARKKYAVSVRAPLLGPSASRDDKEKRLEALELSYANLFKRAPTYPAQTKTDKGVDIDARLAYLEAALLEKLKPDHAALDAIASQRARAVEHALLQNQELSPSRVFITAENEDSKSERGQVRMEMKLE
jgi:Domain of Unknown Function (DUF748)